MSPRRQVATNPALTSTAITGSVRHRLALDVVLVIAVGGALGAMGRYGLTVWLPHDQAAFPWATFWTNVSGCLLIGVAMAMLTEVAVNPHRLMRPFVGVGILGGFTTFSTYTVEFHELVRSGAAGTALVYTFTTLVAALVAVQVGIVITRVATRVRRTGEGTKT